MSEPIHNTPQGLPPGVTYDPTNVDHILTALKTDTQRGEHAEVLQQLKDLAQYLESEILDPRALTHIKTTLEALKGSYTISSNTGLASNIDQLLNAVGELEKANPSSLAQQTNAQLNTALLEFVNSGQFNGLAEDDFPLLAAAVGLKSDELSALKQVAQNLNSTSEDKIYIWDNGAMREATPEEAAKLHALGDNLMDQFMKVNIDRASEIEESARGRVLDIKNHNEKLRKLSKMLATAREHQADETHGGGSWVPSPLRQFFIDNNLDWTNPKSGEEWDVAIEHLKGLQDQWNTESQLMMQDMQSDMQKQNTAFQQAATNLRKIRDLLSQFARNMNI